MNVFFQDPATEFNKAATQLYTKIEYEAHDIFALKKIEQTVDENVELLESDILEFFWC